MRRHIDKKIYHVEILTPKQNSEKIEEDLENFAVKYKKIYDQGYVACITDNPMGNISFQAHEVIEELQLPVKGEQLMVHLNTFHKKDELDQLLNSVRKAGGKYLLIVSGDGTQRLHRLTPDELGMKGEAVTSVELLQYIQREYPGVFTCGVAFNPYEPQDHELEKMKKKKEAGAEFIVTQPVLGRDERVLALKQFGMPVIVDAWMSKKLHLLSECVGYTIPENTAYDPIANLKELRKQYPDFGLYLALVGYKTQFPLLKEIWS
jgi:methylenetetrahydrofolate reductase (NADPH)